MNGRINPHGRAVGRLKAATVRIESQPYRFNAATRGPRFGGQASGIFWVQLTAAIAAASGAWGSQTAGALTGQTVYSLVQGVQTALSGTYTIYNAWPTSFAKNITTAVYPNGDGTFSIGEQACSS